MSVLAGFVAAVAAAGASYVSDPGSRAFLVFAAAFSALGALCISIEDARRP